MKSDLAEDRGVTAAAVPPSDANSLAEREARYEKFVWDNLPRNMVANFLHGTLGQTGFRIFNAPTFLPAYLSLNTGSPAMVGLALSLQQLGGVASPVVGATLVEHRTKVLPSAMLFGTLMRLQFLGIALAGFFLKGEALVYATLAFLFLLGVFMGPQGVAFQLLLAKVIPISRRGQLQAWRNVVGGVVAAVLAWAAGRYIVEANLFGNGYATTFVIAVVLTSLGLTALRVLIREPELPTARPKSRVIDRVREFPTLLAADRGFAHFLLATALANGARIAAPFYILFAGQSVELNGSTLGYLSLAYLGADTLSNLAWGAAGDRVGFRSSFIVSLALWAASIVLLINAHDLTLLLGAFIGLGASQSGYLMSSQTMVLEFGSRDDMAMRLAILSTVQGALSAIGPLVGGLLAASVGYASLFWAAVVLLAAGLLVLVFLVDEPRRRRATEGR